MNGQIQNHFMFPKIHSKRIASLLVICLMVLNISWQTSSRETEIQMPYAKMGLSKEQAAAHLLSRFSFGARPGDIEKLVNMGLETWVEKQLMALNPEEAVAKRLPAKNYEALYWDNEQIVNTYLNAGQVIRVAEKYGMVDKAALSNLEKTEYKAELKKLMDAQGYKLPLELQRQLVNQKIIRAAYGENQLQALLTDFWFNHFNVSLTKGQSQQYVLSYERDAIQKNALGTFKDLLIATAKHPAMLTYLDNAMSVSNENGPSKMNLNSNRKSQGLNENYAREIMELHTLGVDGGYTQADVTALARVLTGWSVKPMSKEAPGVKLLANANEGLLKRKGFVLEGDFLFRADRHDESPKTILQKNFPANGGYQEGMLALDMLANHPSTAKFICKKLATRFVADTPSSSLVNQMTQTFLVSKGDIKQVLITMVNSSHFWSKNAIREKIKSPFEFAISAVRATNADLQQPFQLFNWITKMGQKIYYFQAPTGFPDRASFWINTGSLLNRMNFGLAFAAQKIPGLQLDLAALNQHHEPESAMDALVKYSQLLLPQRNHEENIRRLHSMVSETGVEQKIAAAAAQTSSEFADEGEMVNPGKRVKPKLGLSKKNLPVTTAYVAGTNQMVSQVVGIILGSPEFQRK